jgi:oxygen-dependent protoporphyrinogen oxidase
MTEIVIVGGGISGLSAAHYLQSQISAKTKDIKITLLEASCRLGGVLHSEPMNGFVLEHGSDSFIVNKPWAIDLCAELGLTGALIATNDDNRRSLIAHEGRLHPLPEGFRLIAPTQFWSFFTSSLFSLKGKLRAGLESLIPPRLRALAQSDESVANFIARRFGDELLERAGQPLVGGIYTGDVSVLSASATLPYFCELESRFGSVTRGLFQDKEQFARQASGPRYAIFNSLTNGMRSLVDALASELTPDQVRLNCPVTALRIDASGVWRISCADGAELKADGLVLAISASKVAALLSPIDAHLAGQLQKIENSSAVVINFLFRQENLPADLNGFGFVVPAIEKREILAASFISVKYPNRAPAGMTMVRVFIGGALNPDFVDLEEDQLVNMALRDLNYYLKTELSPERIWLRRWPESMPQYKVGHKSLIAEIKDQAKKHQFLALAGNSYDGVGIPDCIKSGREAAGSILTALGH